MPDDDELAKVFLILAATQQECVRLRVENDRIESALTLPVSGFGMRSQRGVPTSNNGVALKRARDLHPTPLPRSSNRSRLPAVRLPTSLVSNTQHC